MNKPDWLPELINLSEYSGNWEIYLEALYAIFRCDFITGRTYYQGSLVNLLKPEISEGKEATFWHIISEGKIEEDRIIDIDRCKRIRWPKPIIVKSDTDKILCTWESQRGRENRILIRLTFLEDDYLVVLIRRKRNIYLLTAYLVKYINQKRNLEQEYEAYKANAAL